MRRIVLAGLALAASSTAASSAQSEALKQLAAQLREAPAVHSFHEEALETASNKTFVYTAHAVHADPEPERIESAATERVRYQYDDNSFENGLFSSGYALQGAQRFRLQRSGTIRWLEACFYRRSSDFNSNHAFVFDVHSNRSGSPGSSITGSADLATGGTLPSGLADKCFRVNYSRRVSAGDIWVSVLFFGDDGIREEGFSGRGKLLSTDTGKPRNTIVKGRRITNVGGQPTPGSWTTQQAAGAVGIRIAVDHETADPEPPPPDPTPEPPPPTYGPCTPTTDALQFNGGYRVRMCYVTPSGDTGQAQAGIWASGESGLLWFFNRDNAEALVKVLDGCAVNGYRWVFVAPVTDLGLSLRVTGPTGQTWDYTNSTGVTAPSRSDTRAFRC